MRQQTRIRRFWIRECGTGSLKENRAFYKEKVQCADHKVHWTFLWETFLGRYTMVRSQVRKNVVYMQNEVRKNVIYVLE